MRSLFHPSHRLAATGLDDVDEGYAARVPGPGQVRHRLPDLPADQLQVVLAGLAVRHDLGGHDRPGEPVRPTEDTDHGDAGDRGDPLLHRQRVHLDAAHVDHLRGPDAEQHPAIDLLDDVAGTTPLPFVASVDVSLAVFRAVRA